MSDRGDIKESFVEDENKVDIGETSVNLDCVKNEPNEETLDFEEDCHAKRYKITLDCKNIFGEPSHQIKIEEDYDNLIGFQNSDIIMENAMIKLEAIKEEEDASFNSFHCSKCKGIYKGYCLKCSSLLYILNNNSVIVNSQSNTIPTDILQIRETSRGKGVYLLRTLPMNIIFGPFEGILGIESIIGHSWKIIDKKFRNIKSGNWMKNIACATTAFSRNLDIFQIDGNLYFQTNREIAEGEELLVYYNDEELQQMVNSEECLYTPQMQGKLPKIFACTICCLGFGSNKCLMEHKRKCCGMECSRSIEDFVVLECLYCKMWMEKWEHEEYHVAYCSKKHHRMRPNHPEAVDRSDTNVEEMEDDVKDDKRTYQRDICSRPHNRKDDPQFDTKDYQWFPGANRETRLNECAFAERSNNDQTQGIKPFKCHICFKKYTLKCSLNLHIKNKHTDDGCAKHYQCLECSYQTNDKRYLQTHLNKHRGIKPVKCDICMAKFTTKLGLKGHIKNKHTDDGSAKDYKCLECSYQTNRKAYLQTHLNKHRGIKPFKCDICMMKFTLKGHLKMHLKNKHTDDGCAKDYKCSECSYQTNDRSNLRRHLNQHKGIKFQCNICGVKSTTKGYLKIHMKNKHTEGERAKKYKCSECFYQTDNKSRLNNHLIKHRSIKPFTCDICAVKFTQKSSLTTHIKNKHTDGGSATDYKCLECSYQTNDKGNLQRHLNQHRGIKFQCDICMVKFTQNAYLKLHIKNKHTMEVLKTINV